MPIISIILSCLLAVSTGFGVIKQIKTISRSKSEYNSVQKEPGSEYRFLKKAFELQKSENSTVAYYIGRRLYGQDRHRGDMYYNCQYEFLPFAMMPYEAEDGMPAEDFVVLDMPDSDAVFEFCKRNGFKVIVRHAGLALVTRNTVS